MLSLLIFIPIVVAIAIVLMGDKHAGKAYGLALLASLFVFAFALFVGIKFDPSLNQFQFVEQVNWITQFNIQYHLGIDGISYPLILLTSLLTPIVVVTSRTSPKQKYHQYLASFLIMEGLMIGVFCALDGFLFYLFWESMLIPMFIIIGLWGGNNRVYATVKFFLYTFLGSVFMLIALIYLYFKTGGYSISDFHSVPLSMREQLLIFLAFLFAFAVKIPMWPVHTWLPDAHVEAPTGGSVILAAILLKMGGYGFLRFSLPIAPDASAYLSSFMIALSLVAIIYIGLVAIAQTDMKKLIAYSSISHMGFVTLGAFVFFNIGTQTASSETMSLALTGAMIQMISHGLISAALFLCVGVMYDRLHTRLISGYRGVVNSMPKFATLMVFFVLANAAVPGTSGFVGEFTIILASFRMNLWVAFFAAITLIIGASYSLWLIKRVIFGKPLNERISGMQEMTVIEALPLVTLAFLVLSLGLWPAPLVEIMSTSIENLVNHITFSKL
ncbi:MAG TPA: NADH-quinone oxidoreductase subunit M [Gammaproteobacteria bacterium]|jgi:NADH-quinone oxidoreductase subunit M|nr:NADH-quinone oxidoreductase subunit M [Gammaproteobacteria bacterium]HIA92914.1 NADH-quinone oxidoreductase subunit M [Gammaproteobacteria bacterium]HIG35251.1 NADH-quinone oxidoreductase subunit M [Gammaproteobacteria bacterium]HIK96584.1 NADH-quinone oxidoreductase subunit M [Gammaproteobacteria bacterium]